MGPEAFSYSNYSIEVTDIGFQKSGQLYALDAPEVELLATQFLEQPFISDGSQQGHSYQWLGNDTISFVSDYGCEITAKVSQAGKKAASAGGHFDLAIQSSSCEYSPSDAGVIAAAEMEVNGKTVDVITIKVNTTNYLNTYMGAIVK